MICKAYGYYKVEKTLQLTFHNLNEEKLERNIHLYSVFLLLILILIEINEAFLFYLKRKILTMVVRALNN